MLYRHWHCVSAFDSLESCFYDVDEKFSFFLEGNYVPPSEAVGDILFLVWIPSALASASAA